MRVVFSTLYSPTNEDSPGIYQYWVLNETIYVTSVEFEYDGYDYDNGSAMTLRYPYTDTGIFTPCMSYGQDTTLYQ